MCRFLDKLETLIGKVQLKRKKFLLCGDWNINILWVSVQLQALHSVLLSYNLTNTVTLPTRVTKNTSSWIAVKFINKKYNNFLEVVNLGYSDHFAQILCFFYEQTEW
jgi:exonuclease III